MADRKQGTGSI
ncbi:unnamed protein product, partial [Didymodactylos carnosus]